MIFDQSEFDVRCEWGRQGVEQLAPISDIIVIVDVLSFSTSVEIATSRGAIIYPYQGHHSALEYANKWSAQLASPQRKTTQGYSLSPASLQKIKSGTKLVLPSANGSSLSLNTGSTLTLVGCLRNAQAIAHFARNYDKIAIIPAGERWSDGSLRPALEDWIGAGAILSFLDNRDPEKERSRSIALAVSPEAETAIAVFNYWKSNLLNALKACGSGQELISKGFVEDVELAAMLNVSDGVPQLIENAFRQLD